MPKHLIIISNRRLVYSKQRFFTIICIEKKHTYIRSITNGKSNDTLAKDLKRFYFLTSRTKIITKYVKSIIQSAKNLQLANEIKKRRRA